MPLALTITMGGMKAKAQHMLKMMKRAPMHFRKADNQSN
jgi:hypothetical protein